MKLADAENHQRTLLAAVRDSHLLAPNVALQLKSESSNNIWRSSHVGMKKEENSRMFCAAMQIRGRQPYNWNLPKKTFEPTNQRHEKYRDGVRQ